MSLLSTVFKIPTKAQIAFLKLDASLSENHRRSATVTENEIEDGSIGSDHVRLAPESLTMQGMVSDYPVSILGLGVSTDDILGAANDFLDGEKSSFEELIKSESRTPKEAWEYLNDLMKLRTPFSIITSLQRYENMVITSLSAPRAAKNGRSLLFDAELKKIRIVRSSTTIIPAFKVEEGQAANSATSKGKLGKQSTKQANAAQESNSSLLLQGFQKVGIF